MAQLKIKSFTLVESVFATLIVVISLAAGVVIFSNIMTNENLALQGRVNTLMNSIIEETRQQNSFQNEEIILEGLIIKKQVDKYKGTNSIYKLKLTAELNGKLVGELEELILKEIDE